MTIDQIIAQVTALGGVLVLRPSPGDGSPELSWGDVFFYYAPDGVVPRTQPFATIVTKDYPDDRGSRLDAAGRFRLNIEARELAGVADADPSAEDVLFPHPVYGGLGWVSVVAPAERTRAVVTDLLARAHDAARARLERRCAADQG
ncbi:DUF6194 family protein [Microlunatus ginsengisoli]|uniref:DUF6194 domain-containing protein n=1 Tax=Microlunatus ginsengisoli TaxID=363863 RepID=A0ABP7AGE1_9ACTN